MRCACKHCGRGFSRDWNCHRHEQICKKNPDVVSKPKSEPCIDNINTAITLNCKFCGKLCKNILSIRAHERTCPANPDRKYVSHTVGHTAWNKGLTKETSEKIQHIAQSCSKALKGRAGHKHTEETKKLLSMIRKQQIADNGGVWWNSRSKCKRSYAEEWTKHILENETNDIKFYEEYHIGKWFLDFAWPDRKIGLEIDGSQHEWPERQRMDTEKDAYCTSQGWKILRLKWSDISMNKPQAIQIIKKFVLTSEIVDYEFQHKLTKVKKGYYHLPDNVWNERKMMMINSGIDMSKFGWQSKMVNHTGLTKRVIERTIEHFYDEFKDKIFKRKPTTLGN